MAKRKSKKTSNGLFATACILLAVISVLIAFLIKKDQILTNYKQTGFFERIFGSNPEFVENHQEKPKETVKIVEDDDIVIKIENQEKPAVKEEKQEPVKVVEKIESTVKETVTQAVEEKIKEKIPETIKEPVKEPVKEAPKITTYELCFIKIDSEGSVVRKIVKRSDKKTESPLTASINLLLKGPNTTLSAEKDCMNLIPDGTKLLSAKVSDGVAYLNFNDVFEFNNYGVEGYIGQLMQIVYTATSFSTVNSVQFLIEGEKRDYLGSEGQWIGSPLSRSSF